MEKAQIDNTIEKLNKAVKPIFGDLELNKYSKPHFVGYNHKYAPRGKSHHWLSFGLIHEGKPEFWLNIGALKARDDFKSIKEKLEEIHKNLKSSEINEKIGQYFLRFATPIINSEEKDIDKALQDHISIIKKIFSQINGIGFLGMDVFNESNESKNSALIKEIGNSLDKSLLLGKIIQEMRLVSKDLEALVEFITNEFYVYHSGKFKFTLSAEIPEVDHPVYVDSCEIVDQLESKLENLTLELSKLSKLDYDLARENHNSLDNTLDGIDLDWSIMVNKAMDNRKDKRKKSDLLKMFEEDYKRFHVIFERYSYAAWLK